jgi:PEP-CTERM motif
MSSKIGVLASALGLSVAMIPHAHADVVYTVQNPFAAPFPFILFVYDSPTFITTDTTVPAAQLAFANPLNSITSVEFTPSSTDPALSEVGSELEVFQSSAPEQLRYYPEGTFTQFGVTPGLLGSAGYPNSELNVAAPEPATIGLLGMGLLSLLGLRRRSERDQPSV